MRNTLAQYFKRLSNTPQDGHRPVSANVYQSGPSQNTEKESLTLVSSKKFVRHTISGSFSQARVSHRHLSIRQKNVEVKSSISLRSTSKKESPFRYQVLNIHCLKKVPFDAPNYTERIEDQTPLFGQNLDNITKSIRKQFLGKKLKCIQKQNSRRFKTQSSSVSVSQNAFSVKGVKFQ